MIIPETIELIEKYTQKSSIKAEISFSNQTNQYWNGIFYDIRDNIKLSTKNISIDQCLKKLDHKMRHLFKVNRKIDILPELKLYLVIKIPNVFSFNFFSQA